MLFNSNSITVSFSCQQYQCNEIEIFENEDGEANEVVVEYSSTLATEAVMCPCCGGRVKVAGLYATVLQDMPIWIGVDQSAYVEYHRYCCRKCHRSFSEEIGLKYPGARITTRAARWIEGLLRIQMSIKAVHELTGIHWGTIRRIHEGLMEAKLEERKQELKRQGYKPKYLAVDEFAIHKGHSYATCVIDLIEGDIIWVGHGRAMKDFKSFFEETDMDYLSEVKAVAMDMNASYNRLVEENMPFAEIVYDRYHMQAQYGKDVLGTVRLAEARQHQKRAKEILQSVSEEKDAASRKELKREAAEEKRRYTSLKRARWTLLMNGNKLNPEKASALNNILDAHSDLALCYAMKEEMCELFELTDPFLARTRWEAWFAAAKASGIEPLAKFAALKEKRIDGLVAHALHHISTGKLEGVNNKINVSKRIAYGFRDDTYFFTLIRFLSIPSVRLSHTKVT